jgi:hypothetical protein
LKWEVYTAVLRDGVRSPEQFARWLAANDFPTSDEAAVGTSANCCCTPPCGGVQQASQAAR